MEDATCAAASSAGKDGESTARQWLSMVYLSIALSTYIILPVLSTLVFLMAAWRGAPRWNEVRNDRRTKNLLKIIDSHSWASRVVWERGEERISGRFVGRYKGCFFMGYTDDSGGRGGQGGEGRDCSVGVHIFAPAHVFRDMMFRARGDKDTSQDVPESDDVKVFQTPKGPCRMKKIELRFREGNTYAYNFPARTPRVRVPVEPHPAQKRIIERIMHVYEERPEKNVIAYIHGKGGVGKTTIGFILADMLGAMMCNTFCPTQPGNDLDSLMTEVGASQIKPLILVWDEYGQSLVDALHGKVSNFAPGAASATAVYDGQSHNRLLDHAAATCNNLILIMTGNVHPSVIAQINETCMRDGRVHVVDDIDS